jgi:hypothetical protein
MSDMPGSIQAINQDVGSLPPLSGQSAQDQAHAKSIDDPLPIFEKILPFFVLFFLIAFVVSSWLTTLPRSDSTAGNLVAAKAVWWEQCPTLFLALLTASFGVWFILAFTGPPWPLQKRQQCFRFAYSFTITTFIILMFPFLELWKPDISGPIGLVRGCVDISNQRSLEQRAPASISCTYLEPMVSSASGEKTGDKLAIAISDKPLQKSDSPDAKASLPRQSASSNKIDESQAPTTGEKFEGKSGIKASAINAYPWLLTIGGFVGTTICKKENTYSDCEKGSPTDQNRHSEITNGLVVPFYIVFLAFIGGAVSLTRRIPEYQKRAEQDYKPASELAALSKFEPYEARESVVFQIMQLISAPFIAITAYWAIAPSTVPGSIGLAFVSGFASETILMLIRGVVDGIRPQTTMFAGQKKPDVKPESTTGGIKGSSDQATSFVTIHLAVQTDLPLDTGSMALTVDAVPVALSAEGFVELPLEVDRAHVLVATGRSNGDALRAEMTITPSVNDEGKPFSLNLSRH